ncbi:MAG: ribonuclease HII [Lachnospiraceae bacterium]|nr:ribonuclease HII [Lachnospiraceae bacterium]
MKSITEIRNEYKATPVDSLQAFIEMYRDDTREGVHALLKKAQGQLQALEKEKERTHEMYAFERKYADFSAICGIDEVGRGPLAGPVVAAAVILPKDHEILYLNDSKKLTAAKREALCEVIMQEAVAVGIGMADHVRIDEINILQATYEAMRMAVTKLPVLPDILLNDAVTIPLLSMKQVPIIKGDAKSASIAAASIVAKVTRDKMMVDLDKEYPAYGFAENKGYGSAAHIAAIREYGPTPVHRRSFIGNFI